LEWRRRIRHHDRVRHDEHVARPPAPRCEIVALALGQRDHRIHAVDAPQHAVVDRVHLRVPAPRRPDVEVVHLVDQVDPRAEHRHQMGDDEARVDEDERALVVAEQLPDPAPEPLPERVELPQHAAVGTDPLDAVRPGPFLALAETPHAHERRSVGAQVVEDRPLALLGAVDLAPWRSRRRRVLANQVSAEVLELAGRVAVVAPAVVAVVLEDVQHRHVVEQQPPLPQLLAALGVIGLGAERE
jgi:hypothetical protein